MIESYNTVREAAQDELIIKRSRFIGHAKPVQSVEEAEQFIEQIRKQHSSATHNCYAYMIGERGQHQKFSDDGEPSGTAGKPIMEVIKHKNLINIVVVVTRYFGGIMLGAGGLVRAYTDGAVIGIEAAGPITQKLHREVLVSVNYTWLGKLENELRNRNMMIGETTFTDQVTLRVLPLYSDAEATVAWLTDLTQGQAEIHFGEDRYVEHPLDA